MNKSSTFVLLIIVIASSCRGQSQSNQSTLSSEESPAIQESIDHAPKGGIRCAYLDQQGILWLGTNKGAYSYDGTAYSRYDSQDGFTDKTVIAIIDDQAGNVWFGTDVGLFRYDKTTFTQIPIPFQDTSSLWLDKVYPIVNPNAVHALAMDQTGNMWIGTCGAGAYRYDGQNFTSFLTDIGHKQEDSLYHNWVSSIVEDQDGNMWFTSMTRGGASRFDGQNFTHFMPKDGLTADMVRTLFVDHSGNIWFGYKGGNRRGITYFDGTSFTSFYKEGGLCHNNIRAICEDRLGNIWLGGDLGNLCIYNGETFEEVRSIDGQSYDGILIIIEDADGNIWFGGQYGLWKFDGTRVIDMI